MASPGVGSESRTKVWPGRQRHGAVGEGADAELRSLQVGENADRSADVDLDFADDADQPTQHVVVGMAHVDAEEVGPGAEEVGDSRLVRG